MGKNRLVIDPDYDFELYGIITSTKEYKLAWELNRSLRIRLIKQPDIGLDFIKEGPVILSNYLFEGEHRIFKLIKNRSFEQSVSKVVYLLPELQKFDYFLIRNEQSRQKEEIFSQLKSIPLIDFVSRFNVNEIKSKENLIF